MNNEFETSRRNLLIGGMAAGTGLILPGGPVGRALAQTTSGYYSMLGSNGKLPSDNISALGKSQWRSASGASVNTGMDYALRSSAQKKRLRIELRNTSKDRTSGDDSDCRRCELKMAEAGGWLYNNIDYWGALSFIHHKWADPVGMAELYGGVYMQLHMGDFGGSPAVAFRRHKTGDFLITTRGQNNTSNTKRYLKPLAWDTVHDLVYRVRFSRTAGQLDVWLNGAKIVGITGQSIGSDKAGYRPYVGCYFSGGITCPIVAEIGNYVYPGTVPLATRITNRPAWPTD